MHSPLRTARVVVLSLVLMANVGCHSYRVVPLEHNRPIGTRSSHVEVLLNNGRTLTVREPTVRGDTLHAWMDDRENVKAIATADIKRVRVRHFSAGKTVAAVTLTSVALAAGGFLALILSMDPNQ